MKPYFISFYIIFIPYLLKSQYSWERSINEPLVQSGIQYLYNYEFEKAIAALDSVRIIDPEHPIPPFVLISANQLKLHYAFNLINIMSVKFWVDNLTN